MKPFEIVTAAGLALYLPSAWLVLAGVLHHLPGSGGAGFGLVLLLVGGVGGLLKGERDWMKLAAFVGLWMTLGLGLIGFTLFVSNEHSFDGYEHWRTAFYVLHSLAAAAHLVGLWGSTLLGGDAGLKLAATLATALWVVALSLFLAEYGTLMTVLPVSYVLGCAVWASSLHLHKARYE